jgi:SAM-dependent methyltransferase
MSEQLPFLVPAYSALAAVYDRAGYADYGAEHVPLYIMYAQSVDWAGRRIIDLGCGTGETTLLLARRTYRVVGMDNNPYMLAQAADKWSRYEEEVHNPPEFVQMDMRQFESPLGPVDMVIAAGGVLNAIHNLRDLETVFSQVHQNLEPERFFIFDLMTIQGLASNPGDALDYDDGESLVISVRTQFSYETLSRTRHYIIWQRQENGHWGRQDEQHVERGYPVQAVSAMLERSGFTMVAVLNPDLEPFDAQSDKHGRAVFFASKRA